MICEHKDIWPLLPIEWAGCVLVFLALVFANLSGAAGAGLVIPISMIWFGFDQKNSIALSLSSITTSSIVRYIQNFNKPHPLKDGKGVIVDYNISIIMMPSIVVGVSLGAMVNKILPSFYIIIGMVLVYILLTTTTTKKYLEIRRREFK